MVGPDIEKWGMEARAEFERAAQEGINPPQRTWAIVGVATDCYMHGRITAHSADLNVGCGLGKTAIHFATYPQSPGFYEAFDIERPSIDWCAKAIGSRFPLIRFKNVDLYSEMYNRAAGTDASIVIFPYASWSFSLVFLASVFTHIFAAQIENHLREIARVLKSGGTCLTLKVQNQDILLTQKLSSTPAGHAFADTSHCQEFNAIALCHRSSASASLWTRIEL